MVAIHLEFKATPNGSTGTQYNDGITNNDAGNGTTLNWNVQFDAPEVLYYQCTSHGSMGGKIYIGNSGESIIVGAAVTINSSGINATGVITATSFSGSGANLTGIAVGQVIGALSGLTIREEGSVAGSASSVGDINFVSSNLTATVHLVLVLPLHYQMPQHLLALLLELGLLLILPVLMLLEL